MQFFHVSDADCWKTWNPSQIPAILLFRNFDQSPVEFTRNWNVHHIGEWIEHQQVPTVIEFSEDYIEPIFGKRQPALFLFRSASDADAPFAKAFIDAAKSLKGQVLFVVSGVSEGIQGRLGEFIGVEESQLPTVRLLDPSDNMKKYSYPGSVSHLNLNELQDFINEFKAGNLKPFLKS